LNLLGQSIAFDTLDIDLKSPHDYNLLTSALHIVDDNETVLGKWSVDKEERMVHFLPYRLWREGSYQLQIETRLEDLAGNNLNRPFDKDLKSGEKPNVFREIFEKGFDIP